MSTRRWRKERGEPTEAARLGRALAVPRRRSTLYASITLVLVALVFYSPRQHPAQAAVGPYGVLVNGMDHTTPRSVVASRLQLARDSGAAWVRADFWWYSAEWSRGEWDWRYYDAVVDEAAVRGLGVVAILWGTPAWATNGAFSYGVPDMAAWETFVATTVARYRGRITHWEIWNEPDNPGFWRGTPGQYAELLARAHGQIKRADPAASVLLGGLAQGGAASPRFLEAILDDPVFPAGRSYDLHAVHANFRSMSDIVAQVRQNRAVLGARSLARPVVITEASYTSDPVHQVVAGYADGEAGQARYLTDAYRIAVAEGAVLVVWASLVDFPAGGQYARTGLVRADGSIKPAFTALQHLARPLLVVLPGRYGAGPSASAAVYRVTTGEWVIRHAGLSLPETIPWGSPGLGDQPVPADYDGDGLVDLGVYRSTTGEWYLGRSGSGGLSRASFGSPPWQDVPVPADYDGDGIADVAVFRQLTGEWFVGRSTDGTYRQVLFGSPALGDTPVPADYDGDGRADLAVYRGATGEWFVWGSRADELIRLPWGGAMFADSPVPADYDGDGRVDVAVYRRATGEWFIHRSSDGALVQLAWGAPILLDRPAPADYDGDGRADIAVARPLTGEWFILHSSDGEVVRVVGMR